MRTLLTVLLLVWLASCNFQGRNINDPPIGIGAQEPALTVTDQGLILSWLEPNEGDIHLRMSMHNGSRWSEPKTIAKGYDWFVNWADFPAIVANGDKLFVHFLQKSAHTTYAYDVMFSLSSDMGGTWSAPKKLHADTVAAEHGFVSAVAYKEGFQVSWLDGRFTGAENGAMTIRSAYIDEGGEILNSVEIDHKTCDCCPTSMDLLDGIPWVFYRDRSDEEIRDIYFSKMIDSEWTEPALFHQDAWQINGCPVNGPAVSSFKKTMAVAWFTGAQNENKVKLKISLDAGNTFGGEILVNGDKSLGRVDIKLDSANIYVTYLARWEDEAAIVLNTYNYSGKLVDKERMVIISAERGSGFPKIAIWHENLIFVWTDIEENKIKILKYPLNKDHISAQGNLRRNQRIK